MFTKLAVRVLFYSRDLAEDAIFPIWLDRILVEKFDYPSGSLLPRFSQGAVFYGHNSTAGTLIYQCNEKSICRRCQLIVAIFQVAELNG